MNETSILPFPYDPAREMRAANLARVDSIYQAALAYAERDTRERATDGLELPRWPACPDTVTIAVQPVQPSARLLAPKEIVERAQGLRSGRLSRFFYSSSSAVPSGVLWSDFYLVGADREARVVLENGLVCHRGRALVQAQTGLPRLYLPSLMEHLVFTVQVAHQLYKSHLPSEGWALSVAVENLGDYAVWFYSESRSSAGSPVLVQSWEWNTHIPAAIFGDEAQLDELLLGVIEDVFWGFGVTHLGRPALLELATRQGLSLRPLPAGDDGAQG